ncbi:CoA transferase subunit A [Jannaschia sp. R86511]|uniref:CoA transferase subunit A n=1 Tax=Jannaschia sp. R86511 TaxID=3093853 RepID=UPI0036D409C3
MDIVVPDARTAVADLRDGATVAVGGFGLCGIPRVLIQAVLDAGTRDLEVVSNNCGVDGAGLGLLLEAGRVRRVVASYVGENREFARQYLSGELEVELTPQGTLAERLRAGGSGIPAFFTRTGVGTVVADGGLPWRYAADGSVAVASPAKRVERFPATADPDAEPVDHVLETAIVADVALVRAARGDRLGNLQFHASARNFNPLVAMSGRLCVAEVEELVEPGEIDPDAVHLPGAFVHRVVVLSPDQAADKLVERRTLRQEAS